MNVKHVDPRVRQAAAGPDGAAPPMLLDDLVRAIQASNAQPMVASVAGGATAGGTPRRHVRPPPPDLRGAAMPARRRG